MPRLGQAVVAFDQVQFHPFARANVGEAGGAIDGGVLAAVDDGDRHRRLRRQVGQVGAAVEDTDPEREIALGAVVVEGAGAVAAPGGDAFGAEIRRPARGEAEGGGDEQEGADPGWEAADGVLAAGEQGGAVAALSAGPVAVAGNIGP